MTVTEYTHSIVRNFITKYPSAHKSMQQTSHNELSIDPPMLSDWHLEGDIWTHTMMVLSETARAAQIKNGTKPLLLAALLHDIGKVFTRDVRTDKGKVTFYGHPGISTFLASGMLEDIDPFLTERETIQTLRLINYHQILFDVTNKTSDKALSKLADKFASYEDYSLPKHIQRLRIADSTGRIGFHNSPIPQDKLEELNEITFKKYTENKYKDVETSPGRKAVILVGLPGSGKSTYAKNNLEKYTLISRDAQVEHLGNGLPYNEAFKTVDQNKVDALYQNIFSAAVGKGQNVVIDKTNLTYKSRMKSISQLKSNGYNIEIIVFMPLMSTIYHRNINRENKQIPQKIIRRMMTTFEMPFHTEGTIKYLFT